MKKQHFMAALVTLSLPSHATAETASAPVPVLTHIAEPLDAMTERRFFGRVVARETVDLAFDIGGRIAQMPVEAGDRVPAGTALAELRRDPLERAVARARITLASAEREQQRSEALVASNATSRTRAEDAADAAELARVALADAEQALADAALIAPFDALVVERLVPPFSVVEPGQPALRVHDLSELRVEVVLPERLLSTAADPSLLSFEAILPGSSERVPLELRTFRAEADRIGQGYTLTLALPPSVSDSLVPGIAAEIVVSRATDDPGVLIPPAAVLVAPDGTTSVFVLEESQGSPVVRLQPVTVRSLDGIGLAADGIAPGTEVVAAGAQLLADGQAAVRFTGLRPEVR